MIPSPSHFVKFDHSGELHSMIGEGDAEASTTSSLDSNQHPYTGLSVRSCRHSQELTFSKCTRDIRKNTENTIDNTHAIVFNMGVWIYWMPKTPT